MPKAYWIVNNQISDPDTYETYKAANAAPLSRHGGKFLVRAGRQQVAEGEMLPRSVVIEFPNYDAALACYDDPDYVEARNIRENAAEGSLIIVEGYDP